MKKNKTNLEILIDKISDSYLETTIWSSGEDFDNFTIYDVDPESVKSARQDIKGFYELALPLLSDAENIPEQIGHNFSLNRNGHGAGFWDGGYENGAELSDLCDSFGTVDVYEGDNGKLYFS